MKVFVGVDIGGSHVSVGFIDWDGCLLTQSECEIDNFSIQCTELVDVIVSRIKSSVVGNWTICSVGIGCPGQSKDGILIAASNLPNLKEVPLAKILGAQLNDVPVMLLNDADAAVCSEVWGRDTRRFYEHVKNVAMITLGTGIGCGLILGGQLFQGSHGLIEAGHMIVATQPLNNRKCGCGQMGCVEVFASAKNTAMRLVELDNLDSGKTVWDGSVIDSMKLSAKEVFDRYALNDFNAVKVVEETAEHLATLCINLSRVIDPDVIVFSGGMSKAGETLLGLVRRNIQRSSWTVLPNYAKLSTARSVASGGVIGAALAGKRLFENSESLSVSPRRLNSNPFSRLFYLILAASGFGVVSSALSLWLCRGSKNVFTVNDNSAVVVRVSQWLQLLSSFSVGVSLLAALQTSDLTKN